MGICIVSGQKAYNEFHNIIEMAAKTHFRVWLFQSEGDGSCANFQLFLEATKMKPNTALAQLGSLRCEELDMPTTLNTPRYLGEKGTNGK